MDNTMTQSSTTIEHLNTDCRCVTLDVEALCRATEQVVGDSAFCRDLATSHPNLLSAQPLFLTDAHAERMQAIIAAIETVTRHEAYRNKVLGDALSIAQFEPGPLGVFMGYDFHLSPAGPQLIEINTNAGGALINAYLLQAQRKCCAEMAVNAPSALDLQPLLSTFVQSFKSEWMRQGRSSALGSVAIVDLAPGKQYLYPEFVLFQRLFEAHGLRAQIAAPDALRHANGALWIGDQRIDLVYNRLTDFDLSEPVNAALRSAYLAGDVVVTPNPRAHALFADKKNLVVLTDGPLLKSWGLDDGLIATLLSGIPKTIRVDDADAKDLWARRNQLFFKPSAGYGGKAAYRGDKLSRKVWDEILTGNYVAQALVTPSARTIAVDGTVQSMKADLRNYTYDGVVQLVAARLYQGQTTNFRTRGGGFAPVFIGNRGSSHAC
jgi:hypothetical protein